MHSDVPPFGERIVLVRAAVYYLILFVGFACCLALQRSVRYEMRTLPCGVSIRLGACTDE